MNFNTAKQAIFEFFRDELSIPVFWNRQPRAVAGASAGAPMPQDPCVFIDVFPTSKDGMDASKRINQAGELEATYSAEAMVNLSFYHGDVSSHVEEVRGIMIREFKPKLFAAKVGYLRESSYSDSTSFANTSYEQRATLDLIFGYAVQTTEDTGIIQTVSYEWSEDT